MAGGLAPGRAGAVTSVLTTLGYDGFLLGLRAALGTTAVSGFVIFVLALRVDGR